MTEVMLGTVASAAGLAGLTIQLLESGKKLKAFYDDVKDAPEDLKHLQERLNTLAILLQEIRSSENITQLVTNSPHFEQCITSCQAAAKEVKLFVDRLERGMARNKRWGAIKSVLKKDDFEKLDKRLEKAISLLHLCCSLHGIELFQSILQAVQSLQVLVQMPQPASMTDLTISTPTPSHISSVPVPQRSSRRQDESDVEEIPRTSKDNRFRTATVMHRKKTRLRLPFFFVNKIWEVEYSRSISGWDAKFRARRDVALDCALFRLAWNADVEGVKALLLSNQASIYDEDEHGCNAISACLIGDDPQRMLEFCQFFIDQGLESGSVKYKWSYEYYSPDSQDHPLLSDLHRRLLPYSTEPNIGQWLRCPWQPDIIRDIAVQLDPPLHTYTLKYRLKLMLENSSNYRYWTRNVTEGFVTRLGRQLTDDSFLRIIYSDDPSFLGEIAYIFGTAFALGDENARERLIDLFRAAHGTILTYWMYQTSYGSMLMHRFVEGFWKSKRSGFIGKVPTNGLRTWEDATLWNNMVHYEKLITSAIRSWLDCLSVAGLRLADYGREVCTSISPLPNNSDPLPIYSSSDWEFSGMAELELHNYTIHKYSWESQLYPFDQCKITTFHRGLRPEDWTIDYSWRLSEDAIWESAAGRFWEILDHPEQPWQQIPGAWQSSEWDIHDEVDDICWPSYYTSRRRYRRTGAPNRGWRKATARYLANEDTTRNILVPQKQSIHRHQRRLQRGTIRAAIEEGWWKDGAADATRYFRAYEIEAYREAARWRR